MGLISASELAMLQEVAEQGMTSTATIYRKTKVASSEGTSETPAPIGTTACWIVEKQSQAVADVGGVQQVVMVFDCRVPVGTDIRPFDRLEVGSTWFEVNDTDDEGTILPYVTARLRRAQ